ncbi:hypothetical protein [Phenylobacterium conjunctum]|uniref:Uncharacterized protein n=1 Tax=Phenylobacterium conjunctum TaxID=1298959 RepID=A0ABW3SZQ9_9CAUL
MISLIAFGLGYAMTLAVDVALVIAGAAFAAEALWWRFARRVRPKAR